MSTSERILFTFLILISLPAVAFAALFVMAMVILAPVPVLLVAALTVGIYYSTFYLEKKGIGF